MQTYNQEFIIFGRKKGRKSAKKLNTEIVKRYLLRIPSDLINKKIILDIGSGMGESTLFLSRKYSKHLIVASEIYQDWNINLSQQLYNKKIDNVKILVNL